MATECTGHEFYNFVIRTDNVCHGELQYLYHLFMTPYRLTNILNSHSVCTTAGLTTAR